MEPTYVGLHVRQPCAQVKTRARLVFQPLPFTMRLNVTTALLG